MIKIVICGVCGKMGKRIAALATRDDDIEIIGATEIKGCSLVGVNLGTKLKDNSGIGATITDDLNEEIEKCDCVIDFTSPAATIENLKIAVKYKKPVVIGTTGLSVEQIAEIGKASEIIPVLFSPNLSVGVNVMFNIVKHVAETLGPEYRVSMEEAHHIHKKDKPSGTGKKLAEIVQSARTDIKGINIASIREGEIIGDHKVVFESDVDTIEISHKAKTRDIFALGALKGAKYIVEKEKGLYDMKEVISKK